MSLSLNDGSRHGTEWKDRGLPSGRIPTTEQEFLSIAQLGTTFQFPISNHFPSAASAVPECQIHYGVPTNNCLPPGEDIAEQRETSSDNGPQGDFLLEVRAPSRLPGNTEILTPAARGHISRDIMRKLQIMLVMALFLHMTACPPQSQPQSIIQPLRKYPLMTDGPAAGEEHMETHVTFS
ncbi:hypothetical protein PISMIDRAFT_24170 [Pisolithus microcarpus 441]|uniref:Uncharacterized protein n=1 Tax=Pisolithus microcarpus 441 TaxID=765257 RepID=A0A0C9ZDS4_9AGAM|nr:hypothetical protein PISMIDRAFT_24170 [Pisolithus microcarpus 441]